MIGRKISHYRITQKLGDGGMGVVYQALDTKLDRSVALKFLATHLVRDEESRQRFLQEARAAAALNHPNICTIYEVDEAEEQIFIAMEWVDGITLETKLQSTGRLPLEEALDIAIQTSRGIQEAHRRGVVHRDLKTANIMISVDRVTKVLDFGIAKIADGANLTKVGSVLGTAGYMSPEQVLGQDVDHRSDIWALGVVMYEMLAGKQPFSAEYELATAYSVVNQEPEPISLLRDDIPVAVERAISQALRKHREQRYQSVETFLFDLTSLTMPPAAGATEELGPELRGFQTSVAVLPFVDLSFAKDNDYLSDGLTEELVNALAQVAGLKVVARSSTFRFKARQTDIREIGQKLGVSTILDGTVRKSGNRLRVTAQLIEVSTGFHLWAEKFDRSIEDIFDVQDEIGNAIVEKLKAELGYDSPGPRSKRYTESVQTHELYLKGRFLRNKQTEEGVRSAMTCFEQTLARSPEHAGAHVGMADCYALLGWYGVAPPAEVMPRAKEAALKAVSIDDGMASAHCVLGFVNAQWDWDWPGAESEFKRALRLGPGLVDPHFHYALDYLTPLGRLKEAVEHIELARELDPLSLIVHTALGGCYHRMRDYTRAIRQFEATFELDRDFYHAHWSLGRTLEQKGDLEGAIKAYFKAIDLSGGNASISAELGHCYGLAGQTEAALAILSELEELSARRYVSPLSRAVVCIGLGDIERALDWLEKAVQERSRALVWIGVDPRFDFLKPDSRFLHLMQQMGLDPPKT